MRNKKTYNIPDYQMDLLTIGRVSHRTTQGNRLRETLWILRQARLVGCT